MADPRDARRALALLAVTTGFCTGYEACKLGCWPRGGPFVSRPCNLSPSPRACPERTRRVATGKYVRD